MTTKPKPRISRITIGRLYNLGNYEHVRYEVTVDVPPQCSAATAWRNTTAILRAANPKAPVSTTDYERARSQVSDPEAWHKNIANAKQRAKERRVMVKEARIKIRVYEAWEKQRQRAEKVLDDMGAARKFKDAKENWDDQFEF